MKRIGLFFLLAILSIALVVVAALSEDFLFRGSGIVVGLSVFLLALVVGNTKYKDVGVYLSIMGSLIMIMSFILSYALEVHVVYTKNNNVKIVSRCYTRVLATGSRIETKRLNYAFSTEYGIVDSVDIDKFYFISTHGTCTILDRYGTHFELDAPVCIIPKKFKEGTLEFLMDKHGQIFDLHGRSFEEGYSPIKNDYTIISSPLN